MNKQNTVQTVRLDAALQKQINVKMAQDGVPSFQRLATGLLVSWLQAAEHPGESTTVEMNDLNSDGRTLSVMCRTEEQAVMLRKFMGMLEDPEARPFVDAFRALMQAHQATARRGREGS